MTDRIISTISTKLNLSTKSVSAVVQLLDEGATVPFISRYRKERTGSLDEVEVRAIETALARERAIELRRAFVIEAIEDAGAMTDDIRRRLDDAETMTQIDDIYAPFQPRRRTRAAIAVEKGLEPLAKIIMSARVSDIKSSAQKFVGKNVKKIVANQVIVTDVDEALAGASDIIAEWAADSERLRNITRNVYRRSASLISTVVKGKDAELASSPFAMYVEYSQSVRRIASHQYLALRRAEREGLIKIKYVLDDVDALIDSLCYAFVPRHAVGDCQDFISAAVKDASKRLLRPSVENEISSQLKEDADRIAIDIFAQNLRQLLLAAPLKGQRILALDPGYRTGCKVVALDAQGNLLADTVMYPVPPRSDIEGARRTLSELVVKYHLDAVAVGNGTASRETEQFLKTSGIVNPQKIFVVSESGASVYSASDIARCEFPDKDVTVRGAVSIGRRLIDPLAELVKVDPKAIGVGQYQHDVDQAQLKDALDYTVMSCVNAVGVDVNTASERLLSYISGIGPALAKNIVTYRAVNGNFCSRKELKNVPRLGEKAFELAAGFLRVTDGNEPLDNTGIHPESYAVVSQIARRMNVVSSDLHANDALLNSIDVDELLRQGVAGRETIIDIIAELRKPGRDPRMDTNDDAFHPSVESFDQLRVGMTVRGLVNNITAFGAFVDLGIKENGLIHISQVSSRRVTSVGDVLRIGQQVEARVLDIDSSRRRISLTLK